MKKKYLLLLLAALVFAASCNKSETAKLSPPPNFAGNVNVILIIGDDVGYEIPTCDGGQSYSTPHLDSLAQSGMRFTECYSSPLCSPSRVMLLTGKYNFRNYYLWGFLNTDQVTIGNMLQNNGYKTYYAGKWQLDGGDASIKKFGFENYLVWQPFNVPATEAGSRYKSPHLYSSGKYIDDNIYKNKYGEDIYTDSIESFITKNAKNKFFVYYAMNLTHEPFSPTPDNPDYEGWINGTDFSHSDPKYFPDMVSYMDKKIGELTNFLKQQQLDKNTVIIYVGDNGTPLGIDSKFNGITVPGKKDSTTTYGTHVPLFFYWPGTILPGKNNNLVCFPDFLPTLAGLTHSTITDEFYPLDGISFYNQLWGNNANARTSIFCQFRRDSFSGQPARWVQDTRYKLYDTIPNIYHAPGFYDLQNDIREYHPISDAYLTGEEQSIKQNFRHILDSLK